MLLLSVALALACDGALYSRLAEPAATATKQGVVTGEGTLNGAKMVGARFSKRSTVSPAIWEQVLADAESQDEWVPKRFGYDLVKRIDASHAYSRVDLGLMFGAVHVRRQLVTLVREVRAPDSYTTCWERIDPEPWKSKVAAWATDAEWEGEAAGWWQARSDGAGGTIVNYQWWTQSGRLPNAVLTFGATQTLPDLLEAFEARAQELAGG